MRSGTNYQGQTCKSCGEIIQVYSTSGLCRQCFHARRYHSNRGDCKFYCAVCGTPIAKDGLCSACQNDGMDRLERYRVISGIPEHRYVYQRIIGEIPKGYIIHHVNGRKGDNRIENLRAMPKSAHNGKEHIAILQARIRELEKLISVGVYGKR